MAEQTTTLTLAPVPQNGLALGLSAQTGIDGITSVATVKLRNLIDAAAKKHNKALKDAQKQLAALEAQYEDEVKKLLVPSDHSYDARTAVNSLQRFFPTAALVGANNAEQHLSGSPSVRQIVTADRGAETFTATYEVRTSTGGSQICGLTRTYPLPASVKAILTGIDTVTAQVAEIDGKIRDLRNERAGIKEKAEQFQAAVVEHQLGASSDGQGILAAMDKAMKAQAAAMGLSESDLA